MTLFIVTWSGLNKKGVRRVMQRRYYGSSAEEVYRCWHMYSRDGDALISIEPRYGCLLPVKSDR